MSFCFRLRKHGIFAYILTKAENKVQDLMNPVEDNFHQAHYGRVLVITSTQTDVQHPDLWEVTYNPRDWEEKYIDEGLIKLLSSKNIDDIERPCTDVITFPFVTPKFGSDLIEEMEANSELWSGARHQDDR